MKYRCSICGEQKEDATCKRHFVRKQIRQGTYSRKAVCHDCVVAKIKDIKQASEQIVPGVKLGI